MLKVARIGQIMVTDPSHSYIMDEMSTHAKS
jgi:hypothetical protein